MDQWFFSLDETFLTEIFCRPVEILRMTVDEYDIDDGYSSMSFICENVFRSFSSLIALELIESSLNVIPRLSFDENPLHSFQSSVLRKLKINLMEFKDCLYLFDGRFPQIENVHLNIFQIDSAQSMSNQVFFFFGSIVSLDSNALV